MLTPSRQKHISRTSFQLVDEQGAGEPYAGLAYDLVDGEGGTHSGHLDAVGRGEVGNLIGPVGVMFRQLHDGSRAVYARLLDRPHYPLKITELQVRAEHTRYLNKGGVRTQDKPVCIDTETDFYQVEVRDLVEHVSHLPPALDCPFAPPPSPLGVCLASGRHTLLQVRPLRALRPLLSTDSQYCALNLYQLALLATLSDCPFGGAQGRPRVTTADAQLSMGDWPVSPGQAKSYYPLYEDVAYSSRLEIVPFDPALYPANDPLSTAAQETPASIHFSGEIRFGTKGTEMQIFVTHNEEVILIAVRGICPRC